MMYFSKLSWILLSCLLIAACRTSRPLENKIAGNLPASFADAKDSLSSAAISWRQYFTDPNLVALIDEALKNNFDVQMAFQRIEAARATTRLSKSALLPSVYGAASVAQRKFGLYTMDGAGNITTEITPGQIVPIHLQDYYLGFQAAWEVDVWGKLRNKKKAAFARYLATVEAKNVVVTEMISLVANTYYELLALDSQLEVVQETIRLQESAWNTAKYQKESSAANELVVQQFEAQLISSQALEIEVQQSVIEQEATLNFLLGRFPQPVVRDRSQFISSLPAQVRSGIPSELLKNRPDIRQAEFELAAARADVKAARAAFYPSLNITGGFGYQAFKTSFLFTSPESIAYSVIGSLMAPLINRSAINAEFGTASATQLEALYNYQKTIVSGYVEVYNQLAAISNLQKIYDKKVQQSDVLTRSVETSTDLFRTGRANYLEVLITQRGALDARLEVIEAKKRQYSNVINIYKALGGGWR